MNLGFWITWFRYQKLKIFPFEYLVLKAGILGREKGFFAQVRGTDSKDLFFTKDWIERC
jgi:hypothetical protein